MSFEPVIVVHGGAGTHALIKHDCVAKAAIEDGVKDAARAGHEAVARGRTALDAVEVAVRSLENNPIFNAGMWLSYNQVQSEPSERCWYGWGRNKGKGHIIIKGHSQKTVTFYFVSEENIQL